MPPSVRVKCTICGETIRTMTGAIRLTTAPVVCRRCFGHQTYDGADRWSQQTMTHQSTVVDHS